MQRRTLISLLGACAATAALPHATAHPTWEGLRASRQRLRRHASHRTQPRMVEGRMMWVVPVGLAVGWELQHEQRHVRVGAIWQAELGGTPREMARLVDTAGRARDVEIVRERASSPAAG